MSRAFSIVLTLILCGCAQIPKPAPKGHFIERRTVFIGPPALVEETGNPRRPWKQMRDVVYQTNAGKIITAEAGRMTDFASIPRFAWVIFPPYDPRWGKAALIHDKLCGEKGWSGDWRYSTRETNLIFREAMESLGAGYWTRSTMYTCVQIWGPKW